MLLTKKNLPFNNVVADGVASISLPLGDTYERIILVLGGTAFTKAMLTDIKVKLNGKVIWQTTGSRLDAINKYKGIFDAAGLLTLDFTEIKARDEVGQSIGAIPTAGQANFTLELTIAGATAPTLESYSMVSGPRKIGVVKKLLHFPAPQSTGGKFPIQLPYGINGGALFQRVHFHSTVMTGLEVKKNGLVIHESVTAVNEFIQKEFGRVPQTNVYTFDAIVDGNSSQMLPTADATSMEWNVTVSGAGTIDVQVEMLDILTNN